MLDKTYQPAFIEARIHKAWEVAEAFRAGRVRDNGKAAGQSYCIVIPPPNVTGSLHMGHALNNTLQDILCRFERMRGKDVLWQPGTDHAGIATQMVVERQLAERQQDDRRKMGREKFLETVWKWKDESGGTIIGQLKRLGASCDWSRERFTMDDGLSKAVLKVFVELHRQGLIYKDKRLVNWDPKFQSAISDLEVEQVEKKGSFKWARGEKDKQGNPVALNHSALGKLLDRDPSGHMYYFNYPLADATYNAEDPSTFITVATTRPETMLGDTAVAVHPKHPKLAALIDRLLVLPLTGRKIPIVGDEYADPEKGTGAVKITPAHDFNDFEVGKRHADKLVAPINIFDAFAKLNDHVPEAYRGLDRFEARKKVVADLDALGMVAKIEPTTHTVPHGDRSGVPVEPWLTDQWYVNAAELAKPALAAVRGGKTKFVPERFANDYYRWLDNIQPWCISRQLWWGHQIPAWYGPASGEPFHYHLNSKLTFVDEAEAGAKLAAENRYGQEVVICRDEQDYRERLERLVVNGGIGQVPIYRDPDVLDTWFSSALWPFSTLGWPDTTSEVKRYYPTSALVTGFDIIFFWVARMMMMGCHFMKDDKGQPLVPFHDVYIHGLVRDEKGQKMSKSKGNVIDPIDLMDGIGLDALIAKRTSGLMKPEDAKKIAQETRKDYPNGFEAFGADALRFTMAAMAAQGSDVKFSVERIKGYRNFATKVWNASRFAEQNECVRQRDFDPKAVKQIVNKWIAGETERATKAVSAGIEAYKFNEAAASVYEFVWGTFCDWYLELTKPILMGDDEAAKAETRATTAWALDQILKLLHPFMPFITEELWAHMVEYGEKRRSLLALAPWPELNGLADPAADAEIGWVVRLISEIRSTRNEMDVPAGAKVPLVLVGVDKQIKAWADTHEDTIMRLARADSITHAKVAPKSSAIVVVGETTAALPLAGIIDMGAEKGRLQKEIAAAQSDLAKMDAKLSNPAFVEKAKPEAVEEARTRKAELEAGIRKWSAALARLDA
jgi:valyl-tRNA synthetase